MKKYILLISLIFSLIQLSAGFRNFPFNENFDSTTNEPGHTMPEGWIFEDSNNDNIAWDILTPADPDYVHSQPNSMHMAFGFSQPMDDWIFTPAMSFETGSNYQLTFWVRCGLDMFTGEAAPEKLRVSMGTETNSQSMITELYVDELVDNMEFQLVTINITVTESADYYVGFQSFSDPGGFILAIDDVQIVQLTANDETVISPYISGNYPNPFNPQTTIFYELPGNQTSIIEIYNAKGQMIETLPVSSSSNQVIWNADKQSSGIYYYRLKDSVSTGKMILMK
jgi:hypothetical protein